MPELSPLQRDVIIRLKLDPTDQKKGYQEAKQIQARAQAEMLALKAEEIRTRGELESRFSRQHVAELRAQMTAAQTASQEKRVALQKEMADYASLTERVRTLRLEFSKQQASAKEAQIAATAFRGQGGSPGFLMGGFTVFGAAQLLGLTTIAGSLPFLLRQISIRFIDSAKEVATFGHELDLISQKTGIAVRDLHIFGAIGKAFGLDLNDIVIATRRFSAAITGGKGLEAGDGITEASQKGAKILAALGIETKKSATEFRSTADVMLDVADVFRQLPDGAEKSRMAIELFGRSGLNLIPFLNLGREGVKQLQDQFSLFMPNLEGVANLYQQLEIAQAKLEISMLALKSTLAEELLPTLIDLVTNLAAAAGIRAKGGSLIEQLLTGNTNVPGLEFNLNNTLRAMGFKGIVGAPGAQEQFQGLAQVIASGVRPLTRPVPGVPGEEEQFRKREALLARIAAAENALREKYPQVRQFNAEQIAAMVMILEKKTQEAEKEKSVNDQLKERMKLVQDILAGGKSKDFEQQIKEHLAKLREATAKGGESLAEERLKEIMTPQGLLNVREQAALRERSTLRARAEVETGKELIKNIELQTELEREIWKIRVERVRLIRKEKEEMEKLLADIDKEMLKGLEGPSLPLLLTQGIRKPVAPVGAQPVDFFTGRIETLTAKSEAGLLPVTQQIQARKDLIAALSQEVAVRSDNQHMSDEEIKVLAKLNTLLKEQFTILKELEKLTPFGRFISLFKEFSNIISKFSSGLGHIFSEVFAGIEAIAISFKQFQILGGGQQQTPGGPVIGGSGFLGGLKSIFGSGTNIFNRLSGILSLGGLATGIGGLFAPIFGSQAFASPGRGALSGGLGAGLGAAGIGALVGILTTAGPATAGIGGMASAGIAGAFTGPAAPFVFAAIGLMALFGAKKGKARARSQALVKEIQEEFKKTINAFNSGAIGVAETIKQLEAERARAVANTRGGKGGNTAQMQQAIDQIDAQLASLKKQQKDILENFSQKIGLFKVPEGVRDFAQQIADIAKTLKTAADAGATAAQQIEYLNGALDEMKLKLGRDLRSEEQQTFDLLLQTVDLQKQRQKIIDDSAEAERNVRRQFGLAPALSPAQQAAKQIKDIRKQRDEQLKQNDEEQARLKAQLEGRAELFGWSLKDLDAAGARDKILAHQLELERAITAETIERIRAQQAYLAQLASGRIPSLPEGVLPPGFMFPSGAGAQYNTFAPGSVVINFPNMPTNPDQFADIVRRGLAQIGSGRTHGLN